MRLLGIACTVLILSAAAEAQSICPSDAPRNRELVEIYLADSDFSTHRDSLGISHLGVTAIVPLNDRDHAGLCQSLVAEFGPDGEDPKWRWAGYLVGNYIFVSWRYSNPGYMRLGFSPLFILDPQLRQVGGFAM